MHNNQHRHNLFIPFNRNWIKWTSANKREWATYFDKRKRRRATQQYYLSLSRIQVAHFTFVHTRFIDLVNPSCTKRYKRKDTIDVDLRIKSSCGTIENIIHK